MNARATMLWWLKLAAAIAFPFIAMSATYALAMAFPGTVERRAWQWLCSVFFLLAIVAVVVVLRNATRLMAARWVAGTLLGLIFVWLALTVHANASCAPQAKYIGAPAPPAYSADDEEQRSEGSARESRC